MEAKVQALKFSTFVVCRDSPDSMLGLSPPVVVVVVSATVPGVFLLSFFTLSLSLFLTHSLACSLSRFVGLLNLPAVMQFSRAKLV